MRGSARKPARASGATAPPSDAARRLGQAALVAFFAWVVLLNLHENTANDIWVHLRVGRDILATGKLPSVESYSAVAAGRPFIAHEWLSAVVFEVVFRAAGGAGLSALAALLTLATVVLLFLALAPRDRRSGVALPVLVLGAYLLGNRVYVRPHLFSLLGDAAVVCAFERWRRGGRWRELAWLVPVQALWANLHGGYLFGPAFFAVMTGAVAATVLVPALRPRPEPDGDARRFERRDVLQLGVLTVALVGASMLNPRGAQLFRFSFELFGASDYMKSAIFEWYPTWNASFLPTVWFPLFLALLGAMWLCLLLVWRTRPVVDVAMALLGTYLASKAVRFTSDIVFFAVPILVRQARPALARMIGDRELGRRPAVELGALALLSAHAVLAGYAILPGTYRALGWGLGHDALTDEIAVIKSGGFQGTIYNNYKDGAVIIAELSPSVRPVMDSRIDVYGEQLFREYAESSRSRPDFERYLERYDVNLSLLRATPENAPLIRLLDHLPRWQRGYASSRAVFHFRTP